MRIVPFVLAVAACSPGITVEVDGKGAAGDHTGLGDSETTTEDTEPPPEHTGDTEPPPEHTGDVGTAAFCQTQAPGAGTVATLPSCEYAPSTAGAPFLPTVEWSMTQAMVDPTSGVAIPAYAYADFPDEVSVYQAPIVAQFTDDDGDGDVDDDDTPDIAVVMANEDHDILGGVLRVIAGDGSRIVDSIRYQSFTNANGTHDYAPYHFSGTAAANLDGDDEIELAALVVRQSDSLCYPAIYELTRSGVNRGTLSLEHVYEGSNYNCGAHAPAIADLTSDGTREVIFGKAVFRGSDLSQVWYGAGGRGWYGRDDYPAPDGYWNSGYHSFAVDLDGDGQDLEVVAGRTVYTSTGGTFCELGEYVSGVWTPAIDGYPAVGNVLSFPGDGGGEAEIVVTGNEDVSVYHGDTRYDPNGQARCTLITRLPNDPLLDPAISGSLPTHPSCDPAARSFGGPSTIADFDGDGDREVAVAGACYYSVYRFTSGGALQRYAVYETKDWSSSSTGSTVFDFNDDGKSEIVFSDEEAVYVWSLDPTPGLDPWERLVPVMVDDQHKSWTIHEYPLVADVDGDGKAEIVVSNSYLPDVPDRYGIYVLGAADDDWVSSRNLWNQHAYWITNVEDDGDVGYCPTNWSPWTPEDYNTFRTQAPGSFGALAADDLVAEIDACQIDCGGDLTVWVQVGNQGSFISASPTTPVALYGERLSGARVLLADDIVGAPVDPGDLTAPLTFVLPAADVSGFARLVAVVDDPPLSGTPGGRNQECDETNNEATQGLAPFCF
jgi:hypothetical protein